MNTPHTCMAGCGKRITWRFAICADCEKIYGKSSLGWPAWLNMLWRDEQKRRRQDKRIAAHEITETDLTPLPNGEEDGDDYEFSDSE